VRPIFGSYSARIINILEKPTTMSSSNEQKFENDADDYYGDDFEQQENESKQQEIAIATSAGDNNKDDDYHDDFEKHEPSPVKQGASILPNQPALPAEISTSAPLSLARPSTQSQAATWEDVRGEDIKTGRQLGGGGFAVVFEGTYRGLPGKSVAVKMIVDPSTSKENLNAFMDELHTMAKLQHPNIVRLLAASTRPPRQCFIMELCGPTLFDVLHNKVAPRDAQEDIKQTAAVTVPRPSQRLTWALSIARAITYLHSLRPVSLIHRDIKSNNVLVCGPSGSSCKLTDFGLVGTQETNSGTPAYMAPELHSSKPFSKMVDVYAFGVLLWEILSQQIPFDSRRPDDIRARVLAGERPSGVSVQPLSSIALASTAPLQQPQLVVPKALMGAGEAIQAAGFLAAKCWETRPSQRPDMATVEAELVKLIEKQIQIEKEREKVVYTSTSTVPTTKIWSRQLKVDDDEDELDSLSALKR
jgi:serine/threonine protein kinase